MSASSAPQPPQVQGAPAIVSMIPPQTTLRALLEARQAEGRALTLEEAVATIVPLCLDLQKRHAEGEKLFVHPSCITPGADGLASVAAALSAPPQNARDRACLAPELQATSEPGNARASVFSVGAILYECVTGSAVGPAMRRPTEINPSLPEAIEILIAKALIGDPAHRPDDLGALASAMHHVAPMHSIPPPDVDTGRLDQSADFEVDIRLSMLPPSEARPLIIIPATAPAPQLPPLDLTDPFGRPAASSALRPSGPNVAEQLSGLKSRLESDTRPRYVVNKDRMDHGPFSAVELLQQIASNSFVGEDILRDELSGQSRPIKEWEEFSPFAEQAQLGRAVVAEKKEVARVELAEKKAGLAKSTVSIAVVAAIAAGAAIWFFQVRGSRKDDVNIADDETLDLSLDGGINGAHHRTAGHGGAHGGASGGYAPGGMSYEAAVAANPQQIDMNGRAMGPDLTDGQLSAPMTNVGRFLSSCGAPDSTKVTVQVAVKLGRAVGVTVSTNPSNPGLASCVDHSVRGLTWPSNPKLDTFTTRY